MSFSRAPQPDFRLSDSGNFRSFMIQIFEDENFAAGIKHIDLTAHDLVNGLSSLLNPGEFVRMTTVSPPIICYRLPYDLQLALSEDGELNFNDNLIMAFDMYGSLARIPQSGLLLFYAQAIGRFCHNVKLVTIPTRWYPYGPKFAYQRNVELQKLVLYWCFPNVDQRSVAYNRGATQLRLGVIRGPAKGDANQLTDHGLPVYAAFKEGTWEAYQAAELETDARNGRLVKTTARNPAVEHGEVAPRLHEDAEDVEDDEQATENFDDGANDIEDDAMDVEQEVEDADDGADEIEDDAMDVEQDAEDIDDSANDIGDDAIDVEHEAEDVDPADVAQPDAELGADIANPASLPDNAQANINNAVPATATKRNIVRSKKGARSQPRGKGGRFSNRTHDAENVKENVVDNPKLDAERDADMANPASLPDNIQANATKAVPVAKHNTVRSKNPASLPVDTPANTDKAVSVAKRTTVHSKKGALNQPRGNGGRFLKREASPTPPPAKKARLLKELETHNPLGRAELEFDSSLKRKTRNQPTGTPTTVRKPRDKAKDDGADAATAPVRKGLRSKKT